MFAPQLEWRRLSGDALPQDAPTLGGVETMRTLARHARMGTGVVAARGDLLASDEVSRALHLPRPAGLPLQLAVTGALGAAWGLDATTGLPVTTTRDWPSRREWIGEAGFALIVRPGVPEPTSRMRLDWSWPVGPRDARGTTFRIAYQRALHLVEGD